MLILNTAPLGPSHPGMRGRPAASARRRSGLQWPAERPPRPGAPVPSCRRRAPHRRCPARSAGRVATSAGSCRSRRPSAGRSPPMPPIGRSSSAPPSTPSTKFGPTPGGELEQHPQHRHLGRGGGVIPGDRRVEQIVRRFGQRVGAGQPLRQADLVPLCGVLRLPGLVQRDRLAHLS